MNEENQSNADQTGRRVPKPRDNYSQEQYQILLCCSQNEDMTEWNQWRRQHRDTRGLLEGAELKGAYLKGADLENCWLKDADLREANLQGANLNESHLESAHLGGAHLNRAYFYHANLNGAYLNTADLEGADLTEATLEGAYLRSANLRNANLRASSAQRADLLQSRLEHANLDDADWRGADLSNSHLENAHLIRTHLQDANLSGAHLQGADLTRAHLEHANLIYAHLQNTIIQYTHLERAFLVEAHLENARFQQAIVDASTLIWHCCVNRHSDFRGVGLDSIRIDTGTKQLLQYNVRRMNWEDWYQQQHRLVRLAVSQFWQISDYGLSTQKIITTFFKWTLIFGIIYYLWGAVDFYLVGVKDHPGIVSDLFVLSDTQEAVSGLLVPFRALYFSVVTMTTLGFGDMYANAHSFWRGLFGSVLLVLQVILGYGLLGALVTRFAILFTAGGPAAEFTDEKT
ncbi:MAG: pentapeptide repeat-containing protein [Planctomycetota bacterium]